MELKLLIVEDDRSLRESIADYFDYYLDQIILKTEEMDMLAAEMIYVSRLDSDKLILKKELIRLNELIEMQLKKLNDAILNKKLVILYQPEDTFCLTGDRQYLEKVIWNLLSNAVACNIDGGTVRISVSKEQCSIENTGEKNVTFYMYPGKRLRSMRPIKGLIRSNIFWN